MAKVQCMSCGWKCDESELYPVEKRGSYGTNYQFAGKGCPRCFDDGNIHEIQSAEQDVDLSTLLDINEDLLEALKYAKRFLKPKEVDMEYINDTIKKAEGN